MSEPEPETLHHRDRLPKWLYDRYNGGRPWSDLDIGERIHWQEEADTVIRAVIHLSLYKIVPRDER